MSKSQRQAQTQGQSERLKSKKGPRPIQIPNHNGKFETEMFTTSAS